MTKTNIKTLAIAESHGKFDIWLDVIGTDLDIGEAIMAYYDGTWRWAPKSDRLSDQLVIINIVPLPETEPDPEDCTEVDYDGHTYRLPALWEETVDACQEVVKKGRWLLPFMCGTESIDREDFEKLEGVGLVPGHSDVEIVDLENVGSYALDGWNGEYADKAYRVDDDGYAIDPDVTYKLTPVSIEVDRDEWQTIGYKVEEMG